MFTKKQFSLTDEEYEEIKEWANTHKCVNRYHDGRPSASVCGGEISVTFTPTAIGTFVSARCICGEELELNNV